MKSKVVNFRVVFYPFIAFLLGIIVAKRFFSGEVEVIVVTLLFLALACGYFIYLKSYKPIILLFCFFLLGNGFYYIGQTSFNVKDYSGQVAVVGRVSDDIKENSYSVQVVLDNVYIDGEKTDNIRLEIKNCKQKIETGKKITFEGTVEKTKLYYLKDFNSKDFRAGVRYNASVDFNDIVLTDDFKYVDEDVRLKVKDLIYSNMNEDNASIAYAVMFGDKSDLDGEIYTSYQNSGIIHVLTVSGLHVGFLVSLFYGLLKKCGINKILNLIISTIVIIFYAYLCNFSPSVVRAGIMAICMMFARAINKKYDSLNALGLAGFILCIFNPLTALDIGFLMSFFCVFAIIMINPSLTNFLKVVFPEKIASLISLSVSAQLGILPFLALMGGTINLISFAINIIVVPIFAILYPYLFVISMLATFMPFLGVLLWPVGFLLNLINKIATFFSFSGLTIPLAPFGFAVSIIFFVILFIVGRYFMINPVRKLSVFALSFMMLTFVICLYALPININSQTSITYLNSYGQMSVVLTSKNGQTAVVGENYLLEKYQYKCKDDLDVYFSYHQVADEKVSDLADYGLYKFITCEKASDQGKGNCDVVEVNSSYSIGDINFSFLTSYNQQNQAEDVIGILFDIDNHTIFVAKDSNLSYTKYEYILSIFTPELVIAGTNSNLAQNKDYICVTYNQVEGSEYSYQKQGNLQLAFNGNKWIQRGLD